MDLLACGPARHRPVQLSSDNNKRVTWSVEMHQQTGGLHHVGIESTEGPSTTKGCVPSPLASSILLERLCWDWYCNVDGRVVAREWKAASYGAKSPGVSPDGFQPRNGNEQGPIFCHDGPSGWGDGTRLQSVNSHCEKCNGVRWGLHCWIDLSGCA